MLSCRITIPVKLDIDNYVDSTLDDFAEIKQDARKHFGQLIADSSDIMLPFLLTESWAIDNVIYVNNVEDRLYSHLVKRQLEWKNTQTDIAIEFIGAKINGEWKYILRDQILFPRIDYKEDASSPFTFEEISFLINRSLFPKIISKVSGHFVSSDQFFKSKFGSLDSSEVNGDSKFLAILEDYKSKPVSKEKFNKIRQKQLDSQSPEQANPNFWQKWFGKKKLFDSRRWKNSRRDDKLYE